MEYLFAEVYLVMKRIFAQQHQSLRSIDTGIPVRINQVEGLRKLLQVTQGSKMDLCVFYFRGIGEQLRQVTILIMAPAGWL